ncbi:RES domain-containing protein [Paraburkholderia fynbosensis]|uniref:RES domain-containing protein n=1 Tax=Paraburkholderia fynbosensis TaxID=1200993 RepID=A0A6J5H286_9BURK|nr:RES domain-containing protein [Paraburkholderia fynbosensis]CAB3810799.1 hypothetical protein LMG27177_07476 [Paraburkholderia fynbosensis]
MATIASSGDFREDYPQGPVRVDKTHSPKTNADIRRYRVANVAYARRVLGCRCDEGNEVHVVAGRLLAHAQRGAYSRPAQIAGDTGDILRRNASETLGLSFLNSFTKAIASPVARDDRVHVEYLPSQVVSEFLPDFEFEDGRLDGVAYNSVVDPRTWNVALFVETSALRGEEEPRPESRWSRPPTPWLQFVRAIRA